MTGWLAAACCLSILWRVVGSELVCTRSLCCAWLLSPLLMTYTIGSMRSPLPFMQWPVFGFHLRSVLECRTGVRQQAAWWVRGMHKLGMRCLSAMVCDDLV